MLGAYLGALVGGFVPAAVQLTLLAVFMLAAELAVMGAATALGYQFAPSYQTPQFADPAFFSQFGPLSQVFEFLQTIFMGGWLAPLFVVIGSSLVGGLVSLVLVALRHKEWQSRIPYGPYIAIAALIWICAGQEIVGWYYNWLR